jgi:GH18 family chitinase
MGTAYNNLDWGLLTHVTYFSAELNAAGGFDSTRGWPNGTYAAGLRTLATANSAKLLVSVTAFSSTIHNAVLQNMSIRALATSNLISLVTSGNADGIDLDFEGMASGNKTYFTAFVTNLAARLRAVQPGALVTIACPAGDWGGVIDRAALADTVDFFIIMGYDYHWSSGSPGAVSPLAGGSINLTQSVDDYNDGKIPSHKIICGLPYYGIDWPSTSGEIGAAKLANGSSVLYKPPSTTAHWAVPAAPVEAYQVDGIWHSAGSKTGQHRKKIHMLKSKESAGWECGRSARRRRE